VATSAPDFGPTRLLRTLADGNVDFVVVGGVAVVVQALPRFTKDLDITYATDTTNLEALGTVLAGIGARLRGVDEDVPFVADARTLRQTQILTLETGQGALDLLVDPPGAPAYAELRDRADRIELEDVEVRIASIEDLIAMKKAAGRPQDMVDIAALEVARRRRGRRARPR
jgi:predicted nucleotidyltransferase